MVILLDEALFYVTVAVAEVLFVELFSGVDVTLRSVVDEVMDLGSIDGPGVIIAIAALHKYRPVGGLLKPNINLI